MILYAKCFWDALKQIRPYVLNATEFLRINDMILHEFILYDLDQEFCVITYSKPLRIYVVVCLCVRDGKYGDIDFICTRKICLDRSAFRCKRDSWFDI